LDQARTFTPETSGRLDWVTSPTSPVAPLCNVGHDAPRKRVMTAPRRCRCAIAPGWSAGMRMAAARANRPHDNVSMQGRSRGTCQRGPKRHLWPFIHAPVRHLFGTLIQSESCHGRQDGYSLRCVVLPTDTPSTCPVLIAEIAKQGASLHVLYVPWDRDAQGSAQRS
jgi:hypothetical protein